MAEASEFTWKRSRYPLQDLQQNVVASCQPSTPDIGSNTVSDAVATQTRGMDSDLIQPSHNGIVGFSPHLVQPLSSNIFSRQHTEENLHTITTNGIASKLESAVLPDEHHGANLSSSTAPQNTASESEIANRGHHHDNMPSAPYEFVQLDDVPQQIVANKLGQPMPPDVEEHDDTSDDASIARRDSAEKTLKRTSRSRRLREIASITAGGHERSPIATKSLTDAERSAMSDNTTSSLQWKRGAYPLQVADGETSDSALTHPQAHSDYFHAATIPEVPITSHKTPYPASSLVAHAAHMMLPLSPPTSDSEPETALLGGEGPRASKMSRFMQRKGYPLQMPASHADLRQEATPKSSPTKAQPSLGQSEEALQAQEVPSGRKVTGLRRTVYPLQSPASVADLADPGPVTSSDTASGSVWHTENTAREAPEPGRNATRARLQSKGYPLQSPAIIPAIRVHETSRDSGDDTKADHGQLAGPDATLATSVIKHWKRQTYPLQHEGDAASAPLLRSVTPQPPVSTTEADRSTEPIHLPKHMRAMADPTEQGSTGGRTIIVCLDGTGDKFDNDNSNIVHLISALKKDDPRQVSYYQSGIGTYGANGLSRGVAAALDMAVGAGLGLHIRDAYHFLMHTYKEGDKICIFGFSRGAYTALCLAGMIHKVGLLPPRNIQQIPFAYEFYCNDTEAGWEQSEAFKATFCIDVCVYFLGCFDSVASVGIIPRQLPLSSTPTNKTRYFRHAMSLDERRAKFKICRHQTKDWEHIEKPKSPVHEKLNTATTTVKPALPNYKDQNDQPPEYMQHQRYGKSHHPNLTDEEYRLLSGHGQAFDTDALEVWFAGGHSDVGGGAVANEERHKLAQIPLRWMIRQAFECNTGIIFKSKTLAEFGLDVHTLWPKYSSLGAPAHGPPPSYLEKFHEGLPPKSVRRSKLIPIDKIEDGEPLYHLKCHTDEDWTPEQVEDFYDALSPLHDQLVLAPNWWLLEFYPVEFKVPVAPGKVELRTGMNLGRYRGIVSLPMVPLNRLWPC
jgi:uncharacterized protein (DUF2235 family)